MAGLGLVSRRHVGKFASSGTILVDGEEISKADIKVSEWQIITFLDQEIVVKEFVYVLLHKSAGFICSELHEWGHLSYKNLLTDCPYANMLHTAGRLDQDTEWLVLCTNDWVFTHSIISPKKHLEKEYFVRTKDEVTDAALQQLATGVEFLWWYPWWGREDGYVTLPAQAFPVNQDGVICDVTDPNRDTHALRLIITEWKYHQVKRMLLAVWNELTYLRRDRIGQWTLDGIELGKWKEIELEK